MSATNATGNSSDASSRTTNRSVPISQGGFSPSPSPGTSLTPLELVSLRDDQPDESLTATNGPSVEVQILPRSEPHAHHVNGSDRDRDHGGHAHTHADGTVCDGHHHHTEVHDGGGQGSQLAQLLCVGGLFCGACCTLIGFILMIVFGSMCIASGEGKETWSCGPLGEAGGAVLLGLGLAPFVVVLILMLYNGFFFWCCTRKHPTWSEIKL